MAFGDEPGNWNYGVCENCLKNGGDKIKMVREDADSHIPHHFVCPQCGATKRF